MSIRVNTLAAVMGLAMALTASADNESGPAPIERRWLPSFGPAAGITIQDLDASMSSTCELGGERIPPTPALPGQPAQAEVRECEVFPDPAESGPLRPSTSGSELAVTPYLGGVLQLMSPTIELFPGRPRLFAAAEAMYLFKLSRAVAVEGDPGDIAFSSGLDPGLRQSVGSDALTGRGSRVTAEIKPLGLSASLGIAFPVDFLGRRLWLKPSAGWYRYKIDVEAVVSTGFKQEGRENFREIQLSDSTSKTLDGIGPGLELDLETGRFGPIGSSLYLGLYSYRVLGNRRLEFEDSLAYSPFEEIPVFCDNFGADVCGPFDSVGGGPSLPISGNQPTGKSDRYSARWSWKAAPWIFRTGIGFRFHWIGFER